MAARATIVIRALPAIALCLAACSPSRRPSKCEREKLTLDLDFYPNPRPRR